MPKDKAILTGYNSSGISVFHKKMTLYDYYEKLHDIIDSDEYRAQRKIITLKGQLYDSGGVLIQEFENRYTAAGKYIGGATRHEDGTVVND